MGLDERWMPPGLGPWVGWAGLGEWQSRFQVWGRDMGLE